MECNGKSNKQTSTRFRIRRGGCKWCAQRYEWILHHRCSGAGAAATVPSRADGRCADGCHAVGRTSGRTSGATCRRREHDHLRCALWSMPRRAHTRDDTEGPLVTQAVKERGCIVAADLDAHELELRDVDPPHKTRVENIRRGCVAQSTVSEGREGGGVGRETSED